MSDHDLKPAMHARLIFLDQCLTWRGQVNRRDLIERFGISTPQAAIDFREYLERVADPKPSYDTVRKCYVADRNHRGLPTAENVGPPDGLLLESGSDSLSRLPSPNRHCPAAIIRQLNQAMVLGLKIEVDYVSMTSGHREHQWIAPAHFASDGERLHVRAWSFDRQGWRDYLPVRMSAESSFLTANIDQDLPRDDDWEDIVEVGLRPRSDLSDAQKAAVRLEYGFEDDVLIVRTRKALDFYIDRRWNLDRAGARLERCDLPQHHRNQGGDCDRK